MSSAKPQSEPIASSTSVLYRRAFWRIVPLLMVCYTISYLNRINIGFAKLQMSASLGFSESVFGLGAGVFFIGYFLCGLPSNLMMQRVGARRWIGSIMILWGITSAAFVFVRTPLQFGATGFLLGAVEAGFYPGVIVYLASWFPSNQRARIVALFMSSIPIAGIVGNPLSGWIIDLFSSPGPLRGWQWMFLIEALPAVVLGAVVVFVLDDSIDSAKWLTSAEKSMLAGELAFQALITGRDKQPLKQVLRDGRLWLMSLIYFTFIVGQYGLTFWMPTLIHGTGVTSSMRVGWLSAIPFVSAVIAMNLCGQSADHYRERRWHLMVPALVGAAGFCAAAGYAHNTLISVISLSFAAAGVLTCAPLFWSLPTSFLSGIAAAAGVAIINSIGNLAGFFSPSMVGYLRDLTHSSASAMYLLAGIMVAGAVGVWVVPAKLVNR